MSSVCQQNEYSGLYTKRLVKYPKTTCVLCLKDTTPHAFRDGFCCSLCQGFHELLTQDPYFYKDAKIAIQGFSATRRHSTTLRIANEYDDLFPDVFVPNTSIFSNPEKHLYYACHLVCFRRTYITFVAKVADHTAIIRTDTSIYNKLKRIDAEEVYSQSKVALCALKASYQVIEKATEKMTPWCLMEDGVYGSFYTKFEDEPDTEGIVYLIAPTLYRGRTDGTIRGEFELIGIQGFATIENFASLLDDIPLYIKSADFKNNRGGRVIAYRNPQLDCDHPIDDPLWEQLHQKRQEELAQKKKEQEQRELEKQEQKERKERQREEQALRLARAALVEATAKVDVELEQIRKLKELNREVALKNQKIADRKEAEKLAKEAEKRHAEKLQQKELERQQKFGSKKK